MKRAILLLLLLSVAGLAAPKVTWKPFTLKSKTGNVVYQGKLPVVEGIPGDLNARLRAWTLPADPNAMEKDDPAFYAGNHYTEDITVEVTRCDDKYLSFQRNNLGSLRQEAHPSVNYAGYTVHSATGVPVKLSEVIEVKGLAKRIQAQGRKEIPDVEISDRQKWDWCLTKEGIRFMNLLEGHAGAGFMVTLPL